MVLDRSYKEYRREILHKTLEYYYRILREGRLVWKGWQRRDGWKDVTMAQAGAGEIRAVKATNSIGSGRWRRVCIWTNEENWGGYFEGKGIRKREKDNYKGYARECNQSIQWSSRLRIMEWEEIHDDDVRLGKIIMPRRVVKNNNPR